MTDPQLLYIGFVMYLMIMALGFAFKMKWLFMVAGLVFFIPLFTIDNIFIAFISVTMILTHGLLGMYEKSESEW